MTDCPASRSARGSLLAALAVLAGLGLCPAWSQAATEAPTSLLPGSPQDEPFPQTASPPAGTPPPTRVQIQDLGAPDAAGAGLLDRARGGFAPDLWAGSQTELVQKVIPLLPAAIPSPTAHALMNRLLLTQASPPQGRAGTETLLETRAERLWAMGETDALVRLLKGLSAPQLSPRLRHLRTDSALIAGDDATACGEIPQWRTSQGEEVFAAKLQVYCQLAEGKTGEAGLGVDMLREQKVAAPLFFAAADTAAGIGAGKLANVWAGAGAIDIAMIRAAKMAVPATALRDIGQPALLRGLALAPGAGMETRLGAAEKVAASGALDVEALRQLILATTFTPEELAAPVAEKSAKGRALLLRAAAQQAQPQAKVEIIAKALGAAGDAYPLALRLFAPEIAEIRPEADLAWFAPHAARALYLTGNRAGANAWVSQLRAQSQASGQLAPLTASLWAIQSLASGEGDRLAPAQAVAQWRRAGGELPPEIQRRRLAVAYGLLAAFGMKVPAEEWVASIDSPAQRVRSSAQPALWHGLRLAAEDLRLGETVLMGLATLNPDGFDDTDPTDLYRTIAAFRLVGLDGDARALAVEAAIANGI